MSLSFALLLAAVVWVLYMALEPYVRRRWPHTMISWSRLLAGGVRDPLVGRDALAGVLLGLVWVLLEQGHVAVSEALGWPPLRPDPEIAVSIWQSAARSLGILIDAIANGLLIFLMIFFIRIVARRDWLTGLATIVIFTGLDLLSSTEYWAVDATSNVLAWIVVLVLLLRFGLLALMVAHAVLYLLLR